MSMIHIHSSRFSISNNLFLVEIEMPLSPAIVNFWQPPTLDVLKFRNRSAFSLSPSCFLSASTSDLYSRYKIGIISKSQIIDGAPLNLYHFNLFNPSSSRDILTVHFFSLILFYELGNLNKIGYVHIPGYATDKLITCWHFPYKWYRHVPRREEEYVGKVVPGKRRRGRPKQRWLDNIIAEHQRKQILKGLKNETW